MKAATAKPEPGALGSGRSRASPHTPRGELRLGRPPRVTPVPSHSAGGSRPAERLRPSHLQRRRALTEFSWRLLAEAAAGKLDLEALTELQVAWKRPEAKAFLEVEPATDRKPAYRPAPHIPLRSLWAVTEAARALPNEEELTELAATVRKKAEKHAEQVAATLEKKPDDAGLNLATVYAALAMRDDAALVARAQGLLSEATQHPQLVALRTIGRALLSKPDDSQRESLAELASKGVGGDDRVALLALACRRAGGEAWNRFRVESEALVGRQPLSGSVIVLVNRLARPTLELAKAD